MDKAPAPAPVEALVRTYLHGSRLLPLGSGSARQPQGQAAIERPAPTQLKPRRHVHA